MVVRVRLGFSRSFYVLGFGTCRDHAPTLSTPNSSGEGKGMFDWPRSARVSKKALYAVKLCKGDHGFVLSFDQLSLDIKVPGVEYLSEHTVHTTFWKGLSSTLDAFSRSVAPRMVEKPFNVGNGVFSSQHELPGSTDEIKPIRIFDDGLVQPIVEVTLGSTMRKKSLYAPTIHSPLYVFRKIKDVLVCHSGGHRKEKSAALLGVHTI